MVNRTFRLVRGVGIDTFGAMIMPERTHVETIEEWLELPELPMPTESENEDGVIYRVLKAGYFAAKPSDCKKKNLKSEPNPTGKCFLPTTYVEEKDGTRQLYRLPISLEPWATDLVALAHMENTKLLPSEVRFGRIGDKAWAEFV